MLQKFWKLKLIINLLIGVFSLASSQLVYAQADSSPAIENQKNDSQDTSDTSPEPTTNINVEKKITTPPVIVTTKSDITANTSAKPIVSKNQPAQRVEINFNDVDLKTMVDLISKATGSAFLYDDSLNQSKKITLISTGSYSIKDAYQIFENILDINGFTTIKEGPYVRIINKNDARTNQTPVVDSLSGKITDGDYVTMILEIKNNNVTNVRAAITPFLSPTTLVNQYNPTNSLILRDTRSIVAKIQQLVRVIDQKEGALEIGRYPLINSDLSQTLAILNDVFVKEGKYKIYFYIDNKTNSIIALANSKLQDQIQKYIAKIDGAKSESYYEFYDIKNSTARDLISLSGVLFPQGSFAARPTPPTPGQSQPSSSGGDSSVQIIEDPRNNRLMLVGVKEEVDRLKKFLEQIDIPNSGKFAAYRVFKIKNANSDDITKTIQQVTRSVSESARPTGTSNTPAAQVAPAASTTTITVVNDNQSNSVVVFATPSEMAVIDKLITELDLPQPQVLLEVMIMEVSLDKSLHLGIDWRAAGVTDNGTLVGAGIGGANNFIPADITNPPTSALTSQIGVLGPSISYNGQTYSKYSAFIQATRGDSDFNLISNPQVLSVSNQEALIKVGEVRPFQTATRVDTNNNVTNTYDYKDVGVSLKFTARIGQEDNVLIKIDQSTKNIKDSVNSSLTPTTFERSITTNILARNEEIVVLGGLISENESVGENKTFCLGDIPLIGWLFKTQNSSGSKTNLLVYIRPHIVRDFDSRAAVFANAEENFNRAVVSKNVKGDVRKNFTRIKINNPSQIPDTVDKLESK